MERASEGVKVEWEIFARENFTEKINAVWNTKENKENRETTIIKQESIKTIIKCKRKLKKGYKHLQDFIEKENGKWKN